MSLSTRSKSHLLFIDSLRALAALYVLVYHATLQYFDSVNHLTGFEKLSIKVFKYGHSAVDLFIVLSGFSLMLSVLKNGCKLNGGTLNFLKRRAIRILPPYYFAMVLSLLLIWFLIGSKTGTHWDLSLPVTFNGILTHLLLMQDFLVSTMPKINHSLWSVSVEFRIYLFFPFLVWIWRNYGALTSLFASITISLAGLLLLFIGHAYNADIELNNAGVSPYIILFSLGMLAADLAFSANKIAASARHLYSHLSLKNIGTIVAVCVFILITVNLLFKDPMLSEKHIGRNLLTDFNDVFLGVLFAYTLFICSLATTADKKTFWLVEALHRGPLVFMGTFSYSLYLIHAPLLQLITQYILTPLHLTRFYSCWLLIIGGTPVIILLSYGFFVLFERPFLTRGKKESVTALEIKAVINPAP